MDNQALHLLNSAPCGIFTFTKQGIINYVNEPLLQQLQYSAEELTGQHIEKILTLSSRIFYQTHFFPLLNLQGEANEIFVTLQTKSKTAVPVLINATQKVENGDAVNICACITVNQRKKYEDEILEAKKTAEEALHKNELLQKTQQELELGKQELDKQITQLKYTNNELFQLSEIVTHDLQEPIRKINLYVDLIAKDKEQIYDKKTLSAFDHIIKSVNKIRSLLHSLQNYLPILTEPVKKTKVDLNKLVAEQLKNIREENPDLFFDAAVDELPIIEADLEQIKKLFHELLKNSVEFRSAERNLQICITSSLIEENLYSSTEGKYKYVAFIKLTIEDNGIGFNPLYNHLIFRILKRVDVKRKGLGFGLSFCKRIVENHGGSIKASGEEDKGTKFIILLPVA